LDGHDPLKPIGETKRGARSRPTVIGLLACLVGAVLGLTLVPRSPAGPKSPTVEAPDFAPASTAPAPARTAEAPRIAKASPEEVDPAPAGDAGEPVHPHPITPERIRIQHENQLIGAMNDAMDLEDGARLRTILRSYQEEYPEDPSQLQEGYRIIADCLEHPSQETKAAGRRYYDDERGSILRVFVERHCL
jgi:hypothetical protein